MNFDINSVKPGAVYASRYNDREWRWDGETLWTRGKFDAIWHESGWPQPSMTRRDIAYYLTTGEMYEVTE